MSALLAATSTGLSVTAQHVGHVLVGGRQTIQHVHQHDDHVRLGDGDLGLLADLLDKADRGGGQGVGLVPGPALLLAFDDLQPAGVDDGKGHAVPLGVAVEAVSGGAGNILDDGPPLADDAIKEGGLAHVGASHQGYDRL